jgi:type I restriction enzyme S subunit
MAFESDVVSLASVAEIKTGFPFRSKDYAKDNSRVRLLRGDNIIQGALRWDDAKCWPIEFTSDLEEFALEEGDVVLAMDRPWIEAGLKYARITKDDLPALLVQRVSRLRPKTALHKRFLYYIIGSKEFTQHVLAVQTGTTVPHISAKQIGDFRFSLPTIAEQEKMANLLTAIDDKIKLNTKMNAILEKIAEALFKSWFIDFDPVEAKTSGHIFGNTDTETAALFPSEFEESKLGLIPRGWKLSTIGDEVKVLGGTTPSTKEPLYWEGGFHHWVTPRDLSKLSDKVLLDTDRKITDAGLQQISSGQLPVGTVLLSSRAPIGYLVLAQIPVSINQGFIAMVCDKQLSPNFVLQWAEHSMDKIKERGSGTTFAEINKANFRPIPVIVPPLKVIRRFDEFVTPIYQKITENVKETNTLSQLRDELLPKLISGKLHFTDLEE